LAEVYNAQAIQISQVVAKDLQMELLVDIGASKQRGVLAHWLAKIILQRPKGRAKDLKVRGYAPFRWHHDVELDICSGPVTNCAWWAIANSVGATTEKAKTSESKD